MLKLSDTRILISTFGRRWRQDKICTLWRYYYKNSQGVIFVVDSNDRARLKQARIELDKMLKQDELSNIKVLVLANKQDLLSKIADELRLAQHSQEWYVQGFSAVSGHGLLEG